MAESVRRNALNIQDMELTYLDIIGTVIGLVYLYQEYKASIWLWATGIIMPAVYTLVYWKAGLYADFGLQIYYIIAASYGFAVWKLGKKGRTGETEQVHITHFPRRLALPLMAVFLVLWAALYWLLVTFTNSNVPVADSFGNALSIIGLWALSRKYLEQWWIWLAVDAEFAVLYTYKGIHFTAALYALYTVMCIIGWRKWRSMMRNTAQETAAADTMPPTVILADGDYPAHPIPLAVLRNAARLYCCDHAGLAALDRGQCPRAVIGDGDSLTQEQKQRLGDLYHHVSEQDYNDLTKALRFALDDIGATGERIPIAFIGATGRREDHTLGNISLMMWYYRNFPVTPVLYTDYGVFRTARGRTRFNAFPRQQVSIYNFGCSRLTSEGLRWQSYPYRELWQGGLNEATGEYFTLDGDGDYLVFQTYDPK